MVLVFMLLLLPKRSQRKAAIGTVKAIRTSRIRHVGRALLARSLATKGSSSIGERPALELGVQRARGQRVALHQRHVAQDEAGVESPR
jgi:hypothetical protein